MKYLTFITFIISQVTLYASSRTFASLELKFLSAITLINSLKFAFAPNPGIATILHITSNVANTISQEKSLRRDARNQRKRLEYQRTWKKLPSDFNRSSISSNAATHTLK